MIMALTIIALIVCAGIVAYLVYKEKRERKTKPAYILYLMKIEDSGKIEIKQSPKPDIWYWRF